VGSRSQLLVGALILTLATACDSGTSDSGGSGTWNEDAELDILWPTNDVVTGDTAGQDAKPDVKDVKDATDATDIQDAADVMDTTDAIDVQDVDVTEVQDTVDILDTTDVADASDTTDVPEVQDTEEVSDIPDITDTSSTCGKLTTVKALRTCPLGVQTGVMVQNVTVTYVYGQGYFLGDDSTSQGIQVVVGASWPYPKPTVQQSLGLQVTELAEVDGQLQIIGSGTPQVMGSGNPVPWRVDLQATTKPTLQVEANESRVAVGKGLKVVTLQGTDALVTSKVASDLVFRVEGVSSLCAGATFDLVAGAVVQAGSLYRVQLFNGGADVENVVTTACSGVGTPDSSNWGFEEAWVNDPPPDFEKPTTGYKTVRSTATVHSGAGACELTWTLVDNQDLVQAMYMPISPAQQATITAWLYDGHPGGRGRLALMFYAADKKAISYTDSYSGTYSTDTGTWVKHTYSTTAPPAAAYVRGMIRVYDVSAGWTGAATIWLDDWNVTIP
jgi:hypothetical protein